MDRLEDSVSLREYVDALFAEREKGVEAALAAQEKAVAAALEASDKAITKAEANAEKWRENANEWRGAMSDRDRALPSRREVEQVTTSLSDRLGVVESERGHYVTREEYGTGHRDLERRLGEHDTVLAEGGGRSLEEESLRKRMGDSAARTIALAALIVSALVGMATIVTVIALHS
jgi:hypothetical protein